MAAGSISAEQFSDCLKRFLQQCLLSHDSWELKTSVTGQEYLCKRQTVSLDRQDTTDSVGLLDELPDEQQEDEVDLAPLPASYNRNALTYEYHIVYSESFSVPVLYFNAFKTDGKLLTLDEVWETIPVYHRDRLEHERWTFLTQQEHPLLNRPFYQLHPCHTADLMKQTTAMDTGDRGNYLLTWLSAVAPVVGLHLPLSYGTHVT